jgi:drug/metabolite transporter (DMT)-like permease
VQSIDEALPLLVGLLGESKGIAAANREPPLPVERWARENSARPIVRKEFSMLSPRLVALTALTMLAFAANSLLCRVALKHTSIDAATFTTIRLISGAVVLVLAARLKRGASPSTGNWLSAVALFVYAAGFSFAYVSLPAATGALLLFGAVQTTMIGHGIWRGERLSRQQIVGLVLAVGGLVGLVLPGLAAPPLAGALLMLSAGMAWGVYSLRGRGAGDPTSVTAGNFLRAVLLTAILSSWSLLPYGHAALDAPGFWLAVASGALTSGVGYAIWYSVLPSLAATTAATVQLSVPVIASLGGILFLGESLTARLILSSIAILGGIALAILNRHRVLPARHPSKQ